MDFLTDKQRAVYQASLEYPTAAAAAKSLGMDDANFRKSLNAIRYRISQKEIHTGPVKFTPPAAQNIKAQSTLVDLATGEQRLTWIKTEKDVEQQKEIIAAFAENYVKPLKKIQIPKLTTKNPCKDLIPWIQIGDAHLGMLAYDAEVGHNYDSEICEAEICEAISVLIDRCPVTERVVIQDMGDFTHYENEQGRTEASGHQLDCDTRYRRMIDTYGRIMRFIVDKALSKFRYVDVIINQGNHSRKNDLWMAVLLRNVYEKNDRLTVLNNESVFIPYRMGNTFVMSHHSDKCKGAALAGVMANDFRQDFGETLYHYIDVGHVHHRYSAKENNGVIIESFNQLAPSDKYAHDGGWRSRQCLTVVLRSKTYGETGRITLTAEEVKDRILKLSPGTSANLRRVVHTV